MTKLAKRAKRESAHPHRESGDGQEPCLGHRSGQNGTLGKAVLKDPDFFC